MKIVYSVHLLVILSQIYFIFPPIFLGNQSTEAAAEAIATFMEVDSNGWQLLSALSLLVREGDTVAEVWKYFKGPIIYFFDGRSLSRHKESFFI